MFRFITQHRVLFLILLLVLIGLHLLTSGLKHKTDVGFFGRVAMAVYSPIYQVLSWPFKLVGGGFGNYLWLVHAKRDNAALRTENNELHAQLVEAAELKAENERLRNLLSMRALELPAVAHARVVGRSDQAGFHIALLDVGTRDNVAKGMPVVAPEGLVGFIAAATLNASKAVLITDASARADVVIQRTRKRAVLFGGGKNTCTLEFLDTETDVAEGDLAVTTGADGVFPKGVAVGKVLDVKRGAYGVIQSVEIAPSAPLQTIETVSVLAKRPDALSLSNEQ
jgi:rod shape-determining protein MreC